MNIISNFAWLLLDTYMQNSTETLYIFSRSVSLPTSHSIYIWSKWPIFIFTFNIIDHKISWKQRHLLFLEYGLLISLPVKRSAHVLLSYCLIFFQFQLNVSYKSVACKKIVYINIAAACLLYKLLCEAYDSRLW